MSLRGAVATTKYTKYTKGEGFEAAWLQSPTVSSRRLYVLRGDGTEYRTAKRTLTPALSHSMREGESSPVLWYILRFHQ